MDISALSQKAGITLRPWAGTAPLTLLIRGGLQLVISGLLLRFALRIASGKELAASAAELGMLRNFGILMAIILVVLMVLALAMVAAGVVDLVVKKPVAGTVLRVGERRLADFLPRIVQRAIFQRNPHGIDRRKIRTEVVLATEQGEQAWTIRSRRTAAQFVPGAQVRFTATAITGYVAGVESTAQQNPMHH